MKKTGIFFLTYLLSQQLIAQTQVFDWVASTGGMNICTDQMNNVLTIGHLNGTADLDPGSGTAMHTSVGGQDIFVQKLSANGDFQWAVSFGGTANDFGWGITTDSEGNVLVCGDFQATVDFDPGPGVQNITSSGFQDGFVMKLNPAGDLIWVKTFDGADIEGSVNVAVDENDNVYVAGYYFSTVDFDPGAGVYPLTSAGGQDTYLVKLNPAGDFVWGYSQGGGGQDGPRALVAKPGDGLFIIGYFSNTVDFDWGAGSSISTAQGMQDIFIEKIGFDGSFQWAKAFGGNSIDEGLSLDVDEQGNVYSTGYFLGTIDLDPGNGNLNFTATGGSSNIYLQKLDATGNLVWGKVIAGPGGGEQARWLKVSPEGEVYATGYAGETIDFDPGAGVYNLTSNGAYDIYLLKLDVLGDFAWAVNIGGTTYDYPRAVTLDSEESILLTGDFQETVDFDPGAGVSNLTATGLGYYTLKLKNTESGLEQLPGASEVVCFPNPSSGKISIATSENILSVKCLDAPGRVVFMADHLETKQYSFELRTAGMYIVQIETAGGLSAKQIVIR